MNFKALNWCLLLHSGWQSIIQPWGSVYKWPFCKCLLIHCSWLMETIRVVITTQCQVRNSNRRRKHIYYIFRLTKPESLKNNQTNFKLNTGFDGKPMQLYQKSRRRVMDAERETVQFTISLYCDYSQKGDHSGSQYFFKASHRDLHWNLKGVIKTSGYLVLEDGLKTGSLNTLP